MSWVAEMSEVNPKPGDLIEISRPVYQHWAIYIGNGNVVHLAPESEVPGAGISSLCSIASDHGVVKKEPLWKVVGEDKYRINNKHRWLQEGIGQIYGAEYDGRHDRRPIHEIIFRAKEKVGTVMAYNVFSQNCEHFVTDLRYGTPDCDQVSDGIELGGAAIAGFIGLAGIATAAVLALKAAERRRHDQ